MQALEVKNGDTLRIDGAIYSVLKHSHMAMQQREGVVTLRIKNLKTGQVLERKFGSGDEMEEVETEKMPTQFLYTSRDEYWFCEKGNPRNRFKFTKEFLGDRALFLKPNMEVVTLKTENEILDIQLPIKADYKVIEAPPAIRGNTAQGGDKVVVIEGGAKVSTPLFINEGDVIRVNLETGEYTERVEKK
jgi:elongation factor P